MPTDNPCQIYPRVSTPEQKKNVSAEMQQDKSFAVKCGWQDNGTDIIMDIDDLGLSGQLRMEERPAFVKMLRRIANREIKAVIASNVDRLFRDKWGQEYSKFMEICYSRGVKVVTPDFVYDFSIDWHVERFRRRCEEAWNFLQYHVYGRMLKAQEEVWLKGYWAGGGLPMGYVVNRQEKYRKYIIYEPHAEKIRWLFERFRSLGGLLNTLLREVKQLPYLFPDFDESIEEEIRNKYTAYTKVPEGYTVASDKGLGSILSNLAYAGYWVYKGQVIRGDNHEPIVDTGVFFYAFNRLSLIGLDGKPNELALERRERFTKKHFADRPAYLKNHIEAANPNMRIHPCEVPSEAQDKDATNSYYGFYRRRQGPDKGTKYMIAANDVDSIFMNCLKEKLLQPSDEYDDFLDHEQEELQEQEHVKKDVDTQIKAVEALMSKIESQLSSGTITNARLLKLLDDEYSGHEQELARLQERQKAINTTTSHAQQSLSYKRLMQEFGDAWIDRFPPNDLVLQEELPLLIDTFTRKVTIDTLSPHFYKMIIQWRDPQWGVDEVICFRDGNASTLWTKEEDEILEKYYQTVTRAELLRLLPARGYKSIVYRAMRKDIHRPHHDDEPGVPSLMCWHDWMVMKECGITEQELRSFKGGRLVKLAK